MIRASPRRFLPRKAEFRRAFDLAPMLNIKIVRERALAGRLQGPEYTQAIAFVSGIREL